MPADPTILIRKAEQEQIRQREIDEKFQAEQKKAEELAQQEAERKQREERKKIGEYEKLFTYGYCPITTFKEIDALMLTVMKALDGFEKRISTLEKSIKGLAAEKNVIIIE